MSEAQEALRMLTREINNRQHPEDTDVNILRDIRALLLILATDQLYPAKDLLS